MDEKYDYNPPNKNLIYELSIAITENKRLEDNLQKALDEMSIKGESDATDQRLIDISIQIMNDNAKFRSQLIKYKDDSELDKIYDMTKDYNKKIDSINKQLENYISGKVEPKDNSDFEKILKKLEIDINE